MLQTVGRKMPSPWVLVMRLLEVNWLQSPIIHHLRHYTCSSNWSIYDSIQQRVVCAKLQARLLIPKSRNVMDCKTTRSRQLLTSPWAEDKQSQQDSKAQHVQRKEETSSRVLTGKSSWQGHSLPHQQGWSCAESSQGVRKRWKQVYAI